MTKTEQCEGTLLWYEGDGYLILECSQCDYVNVGSGNPLREDHVGCELLRESIA